jgi:hypothetical protein
MTTNITAAIDQCAAAFHAALRPGPGLDVKGIDAIREAIGTGWRTVNGRQVRTTLASGDVVPLLQSELVGRLGWGPRVTVDGEEVEGDDIRELPVPLSAAGWEVSLDDLWAGVSYAARHPRTEPLDDPSLARVLELQQVMP